MREHHARQLLQYCNRIFKRHSAFEPYRDKMEGIVNHFGSSWTTRRALRDVVLAVAQTKKVKGDPIQYCFGDPDRTWGLHTYTVGDTAVHPFGNADDLPVDQSLPLLVRLVENREDFLKRNQRLGIDPEVLMMVLEDHIIDLCGSLEQRGIPLSERLNTDVTKLLHSIHVKTHHYITGSR